VTAARCLVFAFAIVAAEAFATNAVADSPRVFLVRSSSSTASAKEAMNRIEGELTAEGFHVAIVDSPGGPESSGGLEQDAVSIELAVDADERAAELRVVDHLTNKTVVRHTKIETQEASQVAQVLAVRAVELLRASLVELLIRSHPPPAAATSPAVKLAADRASTWAAGGLELQRDSTWGFDAGSAALVGFDRIEPAIMGLVRARLVLGRAFQLRATLAGLGTTPHVPALSGSATVTQDIGLLELVATPWSDAVLSPVVSLGAGPFYMAVDGNAASGFKGLQNSAWAVAIDSGAGLTLRISESFDISLEAHAFLTRPYLVTRFAGVDGAAISQPSLLGAFTIVGWL
jgi:hypothetical protein